MSYNYTLNKMKENITDGTEFGGDDISNEEVSIGHLKCDYCGCDIIAVWDKFNKNKYWPYVGNQARIPKNYKYSKIIQNIRKFYKKENQVFRQKDGNNLLNLHARCHSSVYYNPKRWSKESIRFLCNDCFQKTYNRIKIKGKNEDEGIEYSISVIPDRGETIESVLKDLNIEGEIIGKGSLPSDY